jgi:ribose transport system ATP-binding protein
LKQTAGSLSGGNQQKAMIAKWLATEPRILILDEPTKGIDVYAKAEIHKLIRDLAEKGIGVILISSELPEIMGMCDRIIVMHDGEIKGTLQDGEGNGVSEKAIMTLASGVAMGQNE